MQSPKLTASAGSAEASHGSGSHVADVRVPVKQDVTPLLVYPEAHVGSHDDPLASDDPHALAPPLPMPPLSGAMTTHGSGSHVASDVRVPASQDVTPLLVYPEAHVGSHDDPLASDAWQLPGSTALAGSAEVSHGSDSHVASDVRVPARQDVTPLLVYPEAHVGSHDDPLSSDDVQSPRSTALAGSAEASHGLGSHDAAVPRPLHMYPWPYFAVQSELPRHSTHMSPLTSLLVSIHLVHVLPMPNSVLY